MVGLIIYIPILHTSISVNHRIKDLKKLAEVAVRNSPMEPITNIKELEGRDLERWTQKVNEASSSIKIQKEAYALAIESGQELKIVLKSGYSVKEGKAFEVHRGLKKVKDGDRTEWQWGNGRVKSFVAQFDGVGERKVKISQIDWIATMALQTIPKKELDIPVEA